MTREEALSWFEKRVKAVSMPGARAAHEAAIRALRPVSREQVEKVWRGKWLRGTKDWVCSRCGRSHTFVKSFCPNCGAPLTDKAVQMVMEKINKMEKITDEH